MSGQPGAGLGLLVGGMIVEDDVDGLPGGHFSFEGVEEPDELLMPVAITTGIRRRAGAAFMRCRTWSPSRPGMMTSEINRSIWPHSPLASTPSRMLSNISSGTAPPPGGPQPGWRP